MIPKLQRQTTRPEEKRFRRLLIGQDLKVGQKCGLGIKSIEDLK